MLFLNKIRQLVRLRNRAGEGTLPVRKQCSVAEMCIAMNSLDPSPSFIYTTPRLLHGEWAKPV